MSSKIYSLISKGRITGILNTLHSFTGLSIDLIDADGTLLESYGDTNSYCALLKNDLFSESDCARIHFKAGRHAQKIGEAYIFTCHANLTHIAFPLISHNELLGSIIIGPFLMDKPDNTLITSLKDINSLPTAKILDLYDELSGLQIIEPQRVNHLKKLVDHLLAPLMPDEHALLLETQKKMYQQAKINETIQIYKEQSLPHSLQFFYEKEAVLLEKVRTGNIPEVKALLNDMIGYVLFSHGGSIDAVRIHSIELTTLLSRVALDGGAKTDIVYRLNGSFIKLITSEQSLDELCNLLQDAAESFMNAMFNETDKGNMYIRTALKYIMNHYGHSITLNDVAEEVGLSPNYFSTIFHKIVGMNFREYLNRVRVEESKRLLLSTDYPITDIAIAMGFPDQSYYCKVFKSIVGVTPGKYRS